MGGGGMLTAPVCTAMQINSRTTPVPLPSSFNFIRNIWLRLPHAPILPSLPSGPPAVPPPPPHLSPSNFQIFCSIFWEAIKQRVFSHCSPPCPRPPTTASALLPPSVSVFARSRRRCGCGGGQSEPSDARSQVKPPRRRMNILTWCISGAPGRNRTGTRCAPPGADDSASHRRTRAAASPLKCGRRRQKGGGKEEWGATAACWYR